MTSTRMRLVLSIALATMIGLSAGFATHANATAIFDAYAYSELRITDIKDNGGSSISLPADLEISYDDPDIYREDDTYTEGNASAHAEASGSIVGNPLSGSGGFDLSAEADGTAVAPPESYAGSYAWTDAILYFENYSDTESYTIDFSLDYVYSVEASVDDPLNEYAFATISIYVEEMYFIFPVVDIFDYSDTDEGGGLFTGSGTEYFSITVNPDSFNGICVYTDVNEGYFDGIAGARPIPEPATMILLGTALLGLAGTRRKSGK